MMIRCFTRCSMDSSTGRAISPSRQKRQQPRSSQTLQSFDGFDERPLPAADATFDANLNEKRSRS
ncbi:hypothetical protein BN2476_650094 [Paraburkholderia piptadeniae]|uniref:Uncharacterized protein n=1 Tax=Paraburkholderia piptadeniae TaxID=1701573 RepID=A0A1N7SN60_9BURK|nr:hypothetical protein BN2476_650094 [Paraburkholderia piptadeniae]